MKILVISANSAIWGERVAAVRRNMRTSSAKCAERGGCSPRSEFCQQVFDFEQHRTPLIEKIGLAMVRGRAEREALFDVLR